VNEKIPPELHVQAIELKVGKVRSSASIAKSNRAKIDNISLANDVPIAHENGSQVLSVIDEKSEIGEDEAFNVIQDEDQEYLNDPAQLSPVKATTGYAEI